MVSTHSPNSVYAWNPSQKRSVAHAVCGFSITSSVQVIRGCINDLNARASAQALPEALSAELRALLVWSAHPIAKARDIASKYLNRLITSFPSLMCDPPLVYAILEVLTLLRRACENEFTDEVGFMVIRDPFKRCCDD
jgi:phosphatidylinositol 4-kinase